MVRVYKIARYSVHHWIQLYVLLLLRYLNQLLTVLLQASQLQNPLLFYLLLHDYNRKILQTNPNNNIPFLLP